LVRKLIGMYVLAVGSSNRLQKRKQAIAFPSGILAVDFHFGWHIAVVKFVTEGMTVKMMKLLVLSAIEWMMQAVTGAHNLLNILISS